MKETRRLVAGVTLAATLVFAQTKPAFEVATDQTGGSAGRGENSGGGSRRGSRRRSGPHIDARRAEYSYMPLRDLIASCVPHEAVYQVTGPDWLAGPRFDILAKFPGRRFAGRGTGDATNAARRTVPAGSASEQRGAVRCLRSFPGKGGAKLKASTGLRFPLMRARRSAWRNQDGHRRRTCSHGAQQGGRHHGQHGTQGHHDL